MKKKKRSSKSVRRIFGHRLLPAIFFQTALIALLWFDSEALAQWKENQGPEPNKQPEINAFQQSILHDLWRDAVLQIRQGKLKEAEQQIRRMIGLLPQAPDSHYFLASVLARQIKMDAAFDRLTIAIERGFSNVELMQSDAGFERLRQQERFQTLIKMIEENPVKQEAILIHKVSPALVRNGIALVNEDNTVWDPKLNILKSFFRFETKEAAAEKVRHGESVLNEWYSRGLAAGNISDLYDNHDRKHSVMRVGTFPQMGHVKYSPSALAAGVDHGLNTKMFFNAITIGNSSTVSAGRSQARQALTLSNMPNILYLQYINNHLYVYPEHRDYDPERGDLLPANTPYLIVSQGSSGSDQPFLRAAASILAAFRPDVKDYLRHNRLVMPTVQMIFRRGQEGVETDTDYLSARAHPPVFKAEDIDLVKMINLANQFRIEVIPPMVRLKVIAESSPQPGVDDFSTAVSETLFDTPSTIARVVRSTAYEKRMVISAEQTKPSAGQNLEYHWVVLNGDADRIKINPKNDAGSVVELVVPWHERRIVPENPETTTDRVEIGVFVHNGTYFSAPAFINFLYPPNQKRIYDEQQRIVSIDHNDPELTKRTLEERLFVQRDWKDIYNYNHKSQLVGWQRQRGNWVTHFTRHGAKVIDLDDQNRPIKARTVSYKLEIDERGKKTMVDFSTPDEKLLFYQYNGEEDQMGTVRVE